MAQHAVDVDETFREEIPSELLERVAEHHKNLYQVSLQIKRGGKWNTLKQGTRQWTVQPPDASVHDICLYLVTLAVQDADRNGEGQRYRARLRGRTSPNGPEYSRFASVRGVMGEDGAIAIVDDAGSDSDPLRVLMAAKEQSDNVSFKCLDALASTVVKFGLIADAFTGMMIAAGESYARNVGGQADLLRVQIELEQNQHQHQQTMAKFERGFGLLEGPVGRVGDEIVDTIISTMREKRAGSGGSGGGGGGGGGSGDAPNKRSGRPRPGGASSSSRASRPAGAKAQEPAQPAPPKAGESASALDGVFASLSSEKTQRAQQYMTADEWSLLQAARTAATDELFDQLFSRFYVELRKRDVGDDDGTTKWVTTMREIVGDNGVIQIGYLIQKLEQGKNA